MKGKSDVQSTYDLACYWRDSIKYEKLIYKFENEDRPNLILNRDKITNEPVYSISQNIGLGLPPPKQLATPLAKKNKNYIWDFYAEGSTSILIKRIKSLYKNKK